MFSGKRAVILIVSISFFSFFPDLTLGEHPLGKIIIYNEGKTILGESKHYRIIKIQKTSIGIEMEMEILEKGGLMTPSLYGSLGLGVCPCVHKSFELNYLTLQDTASKIIPDKVNYVYVDFINLKSGFMTTEKTSLGEHVKGEYGSITIEVPELRGGFSEKEHELIWKIIRRKSKGILDKEEWRKFLDLVEPKLTCKPQKEIKTIWLNN
jgi:hypothetical protein